MEKINNIVDMQMYAQKMRKSGKTIALVPTMGYLHNGHATLIDLARKKADIVVLSRFINPSQFAPNEDLDAYPKDANADYILSESHGVDCIFEPEANEMYPGSHLTWVEIPHMANTLCGVTRHTHFRGVATVVAKLFNIVTPHFAVFGEKDWQQLSIIRKMVADLNFSVEILAAPLVREEDGLAMSSRNVYLTEKERALAPHISKGLTLLKEEIVKGETHALRLQHFFRNYLAKEAPLAKIEYCSIFNEDTLHPLDIIEPKARVATAVILGKARLLDNMSLVD